MKYLALIYHPIDALEHYSEEEHEALIAEHVALQAETKKAGSFVVADRLDSVRTAKTLTKKAGEIVVSDGPFAETKEVLVGYYLFECRDHNHAIELASKIPMPPSTKIEVRPVFFHVA